LYESSLSLFFVELNTNASFAGSARCTGKPLFLRSLVTYLPDVDCSSDISGFMEEYLSTNVFYASSLFSISFFNRAILFHLCYIYHTLMYIHSYQHIHDFQEVVRV
jgi:hypothetical protein